MKAFRKDFYIQVKNTLNRFISILLIVALGAAFYAGIRSAEPDMQLSADKLYDDTLLMDVKIQSTLGLTDDDVAAVDAMDSVRLAEGSFSEDVIAQANGVESVVRVMSYSQNVNLIELDSGRLPENENECVIDRQFAGDDADIGDTITFESEYLGETEFEIVGIFTSSMYLAAGKGTSSIGNGQVSGIAVVLEDAFDIDYYTEIYVLAEGALELTSYTDEYDDLIESLVDEIEETISSKREAARYNEIVGEAADEIEEGRDELAKAKSEYEDGLNEVDEGYRELSEAEEELLSAQAELDEAADEIAAAEQEIADGRAQIAEEQKQLDALIALFDEALIELKENGEELDDAEALIAENEAVLSAAVSEYESGLSEYESGLAEYESGLAEYESGLAEYESSYAEYESGLAQYEAGYEEYLAAVEIYGEEALSQTKSELDALKEELDAAGEELTAVWAQLSAAEKELAVAKEELEAAEEELSAALAEITQAQEEIDAAKEQISESRALIEAGYDEVMSGYDELFAAEAELKSKSEELAAAEEELSASKAALSEAGEEILNGQDEIDEGYDELSEAEQELADAKAEIEDAEEELSEAEDEIADISYPEWYVFDRSCLTSYTEYGQDAEKIGNIGRIVPVLFFLVAALVSLNTMTRMVGEDRTKIGTFKALGFGNIPIALRYVIYGSAATLIGSVAGGIAGSLILPKIIMTAYQLMFPNMEIVLTPIDPVQFTVAVGASFISVIAATIMACARTLRQSPAELMRPAAPKKGKRVLLEKVPFIWNRLSFQYKSTFRNLFRYKKRLFMTLFGIGGCMALMLIGYGVKDSVSSLSELQYGQLNKYDFIVAYDDGADEEELDAASEAISSISQMQGTMDVLQLSADVYTDEYDASVYVIVPDDEKEFSEYVCLRDRRSNDEYSIPSSGVIITEKLAKLLDVSEGDSIFVENEDGAAAQVTVSEVCENYLYHYVYMSKETYFEIFGEEWERNVSYLLLDDDAEYDRDDIVTVLLECEAVSSVSATADTRETFEEMLSSLDIIVVVLVVCAGALAFIVLYNLNNINIAERKREIATLKVLGFYDGEVSAYIFRENVIITILGMMLGVILGIILHRYIMITVEFDIVMFGRNIKAASYIYSILFTLLFSVIINTFMHFELKKVDMTESLKSVE